MKISGPIYWKGAKNDKRRTSEKYGSFLYCPKRDTLCFGQDLDESDGTCPYEACVLDDPEWQARQERIKQRQKELWDKHHKNRKEEREAAKNIRTQNKTSRELLAVEIERKKARMERCYRRGWTQQADKLGRELAEMERRLRA
ncbi:MAG: hypothetical protein HFE75_15040 [Firmicutes bacterium]|nr:hypothetical protein [Bacillota bacterium]